MVSSLTGRGRRISVRRPPGSMPASPCRTPRRGQRPQDHRDRPRRPDQPHRGVYRGPGRPLEGGPRARLDKPPFFLAPKVPNQQGVPVTGGFFDGPEWGTQPYTNMFAADNGSVDTKYPVNTSDRGVHEEPRWHRPSAHTGTGSRPPRRGRHWARSTYSCTPEARRVLLDTSVPFGGGRVLEGRRIGGQAEGLQRLLRRPRRQLECGAGHRVAGGQA